MNGLLGYRCSICGAEYGPVEVTYTCPKDGGNLDVVLDLDTLRARYQPSDIASRSDASLWRYLPLLPVGEFPGDATPLHAAGVMVGARPDDEERVYENLFRER